MAQSAETLKAFAESMKGLNKKEMQAHKNWFTRKQNQMEAHEMKIAFMNWMSKDDEAKYYAGVALGAATGAIGIILSEFMGQVQAAPPGQEAPPTPPEPPNLAWLWLGTGGPGGIAGLATSQLFDKVQSTPDSIGGGITQLMTLGGTGFAGFCASVLLLKAIFSGTDLGELMSGAGEIIPL